MTDPGNNAGYSRIPLTKKLGIREGYILKLVNPPPGYFDLFDHFPENVRFEDNPAIRKDLIHCFIRSGEALLQLLPGLKEEIGDNGSIWISWPRKASGIATDVTGDVVRAAAFSNGMVDIKVCAVDPIWSGLKLVIPVKDREHPRRSRHR